jgi:hypothetical protein
MPLDDASPSFAEILIQKANQYADQAVGLQSWVASSGSKTNSLSGKVGRVL